MHIAVTTGNVEMLKFLMQNMASPYTKTSGKTPLQVVPDDKPERARAKRKWGCCGANFFKWLACQYARPICDSCEGRRAKERREKEREREIHQKYLARQARRRPQAL